MTGYVCDSVSTRLGIHTPLPPKLPPWNSYPPRHDLFPAPFEPNNCTDTLLETKLSFIGGVSAIVRPGVCRRYFDHIAPPKKQ
jgi:hypothetical protein